MIDFYVNGLRLPPDLYEMIRKECERQKAFNGFWPGVFSVIIDALYTHFRSIESSYTKEDFEK